MVKNWFNIILTILICNKQFDSNQYFFFFFVELIQQKVYSRSHESSALKNLRQRLGYAPTDHHVER